MALTSRDTLLHPCQGNHYGNGHQQGCSETHERSRERLRLHDGRRIWRLLRGGDVWGFDAHVTALAAGPAEATEQKDDQSTTSTPPPRMELAFPDSTAITLLLLTLFLKR